MSIPLGQAPLDNTGAVTPGQAPVQGQAPVESEATATTGTAPLPRTEQPIQDQMAPAPAGYQQLPAPAMYAASAQGPVLPKPLEPKQEKKVEKEGSGNADQTQSSDGNPPQVDGEHKAHHEQQDDSGGQSGGNSGGGNSGSDSGGSGSFTGGGDSNSRRESGGAGPVEGSSEAAAPAGVDPAAAAPGEEDTLQTQENQYLKALDPTGTATISASGLYSPPQNGAQFFENAGKIMQEIVDINMNFIDKLPAGPEKFRFTDFLKMVQDALNQFQQLLRELQLNDSKGAKERSKAQLETSLEKIEEQRKQQAEMAKKTEEAAKKAKLMSGLAILFAFLMILFFVLILPVVLPLLILTLPPLGMLVIGLIVAEFLDQCAKAVGQKAFAIEGIANAVMAVIDAFVHSAVESSGGTSEDEKNAKAALKVVTTALIMAVATAMAPAFMVFGGCMTLLDFLSASHCIKAAAMAGGMEETQADQVEMYVGIAVGAIFAIAAFAVAFVMPVGGLAGALNNMIKTAAQKAAELIQKIIEYVIKVSDVVAQNIIKSVQAVLKEALNPENWIQATGLGLQTANAVATYNYQTILADIAIINGQLDSYTELKDSTIQALKKMIKQLLDALGGISDDIAAVTRSLKQTHVGISQITGDLFG